MGNIFFLFLGILLIINSKANFLCNNLQAMVHELIGIQDNKVDLRNMDNVPKDQQVELHSPVYLTYMIYITFVVLIGDEFFISQS